MAEIILSETASVSTPSAGTVSTYCDNSANPMMKVIDDSGAIRPGAGYSSQPLIGLGYIVGAGLAVTQATNRSTGVTINAICGTITGNATSLAAAADAVFVVTNSACALRDVVILSHVSGSTANTSIFEISAVAAGSFSIRIKNVSAATADTGAPILNFAIIKAVNS